MNGSYNSHERFREREAKVFFSEVDKSCPIPDDGIPVWQIPQHVASSQICWSNFSKKRQVLLAAMEPVGEYPPITGFFHITLNVTSYLIRDRHDVCPGFSARIFGACVAGCAKRCPGKK